MHLGYGSRSQFLVRPASPLPEIPTLITKIKVERHPLVTVKVKAPILWSKHDPV